MNKKQKYVILAAMLLMVLMFAYQPTAVYPGGGEKYDTGYKWAWDKHEYDRKVAGRPVSLDFETILVEFVLVISLATGGVLILNGRRRSGE